MPEEFAGATLAREGAADAEWLSALPTLVERLRVRWDLEVDGPAMHGYVALVVPVRRTDGRPAVLKVSWVDAETRVEAVALAAWRDAPAVDLLAAAPEAGALLLERLAPHRCLLHVDEDEAVTVAATLLRQLHVRPVEGLTDVADIAHRLETELCREWEDLCRPGLPGLVGRAITACEELGTSPGRRRLLHGDFHDGNVLARATSSGSSGAPGGGRRRHRLADRRGPRVTPGAPAVRSRAWGGATSWSRASPAAARRRSPTSCSVGAISSSTGTGS